MFGMDSSSRSRLDSEHFRSGPKDVPAALWQAERAVDRPAAAPRRLGGGPDIWHERGEFITLLGGGATVPLWPRSVFEERYATTA